MAGIPGSRVVSSTTVSVTLNRNKNKKRKAPKAPVSKTTDKGIEVQGSTASDAGLKALQDELALQRVTQEQRDKEAAVLREQRRTAATKTAELQRQALGLQIEERQSNLGREVAGLNRSARQARSALLSNAAGAGVIGTSAYKGTRAAIKSNLTGEQQFLQSGENRQLRADEIKKQEIDASLQAKLAEEQDPLKVYLGSDSNTGTAKKGQAIFHTQGSTSSDTAARLNAFLKQYPDAKVF